MKKHLEKMSQRFDTLCNNWWRIGLFFMMICAGISMVIITVWFTGVGIHSEHVDVTPTHVRTK